MPARANQLKAWNAAGMFNGKLDIDPDDLASLAPLGDTSRSVEDRVRSYWDANCSMCHGSKSGLRSEWDARYETPLAEQGVVNGRVVDGPEDGRAIVVPGEPDKSVLYLRDKTIDPARRMPPLGRAKTDPEYIELLEAWIRGL